MLSQKFLFIYQINMAYFIIFFTEPRGHVRSSSYCNASGCSRVFLRLVGSTFSVFPFAFSGKGCRTLSWDDMSDGGFPCMLKTYH